MNYQPLLRISASLLVALFLSHSAAAATKKTDEKPAVTETPVPAPVPAPQPTKEEIAAQKKAAKEKAAQEKAAAKEKAAQVKAAARENAAKAKAAAKDKGKEKPSASADKPAPTDAEIAAAAASWKENATEVKPGSGPKPQDEDEPGTKPEGTAGTGNEDDAGKLRQAPDPHDPATQPGTPEYKKAQKEAAAKEKTDRQAARERAAADVRAAKDREKIRKEDEKDLTKEQREEWAIREAALRYMLSVESPGEVVFISFTPLDSVNMRWNDPPDGFLRRLIDVPVQLRPATKAILTRQPVADPERPNRMVQDPVTKNAGSIYWADILKDSKAGETRVDSGCFRGFLKSWGCILVMKKVRGSWQVAAQTAVWKT